MATKRLKSPLCSLQKLSTFYTGGSVAVTPDEQSVVCACGEDVKVVNMCSGVVTISLPGDSEPITALCIHPNGKSIVASSRSLAHTAPVCDVAFDASGGYIATGSAAREVKIWDADAGYCTHSLLEHAGVVFRVLFHPSFPLLATAGDDGVVVISELTSKKVVFKLTGHVSAVTAIAWTLDGQHILSAGRDKVVVLWDIKAGTKVRSIAVLESIEALILLPRAMRNVLQSDASSPDSIPFATGGEEGAVKFWSAQTGRCVLKAGTTGKGSALDAVVNLILLPGSRKILIATADCTLTVASLCATLLKSERKLLGNLGEVTSATFLEMNSECASPDMAQAAKDAPEEAMPPGSVAVATSSSSFYLLSSRAFSCTRVFEGHSDGVLCIAAYQLQQDSASAWIVASGSKDNTVRVWHVPSGCCLAIGSGHLGSVCSVAFFSKQTPCLLSGGADKLIQTWDLGSVWDILAEGNLPINPIALSVSAAVAAHDKEVNCVTVSPSNKLAASGGADRKARVWRLPALSMPVVLSGHKRGVWDVQFAPIDQAVLTASGDATLRVWSVKDGSCIRTFVGHGSSVLRARFCAMGTKVVSSGSDGLMKVWNFHTGHCLSTVEAHEGKAWALDIGGENKAFAVSGADDGSLVLWGDASKGQAATLRQEHEKNIQEHQVLETALLGKQYIEAAKLAIRLQKPGKLLHIVREAITNNNGSPEATLDFTLVTKDLDNDQLRRLITYVRDWNTSPKHFCCAHAMLHSVLTSKHPQELSALHGLHDVIEGLLLYSSRHYGRMDRLLQSTFLLDYVQGRLNSYNANHAE